MSLGLGAMLKIWVTSSYIEFWLWPGLTIQEEQEEEEEEQQQQQQRNSKKNESTPMMKI